MMDMNVQSSVQHLVMETRCLVTEEKTGTAVCNLNSVCLIKAVQDLMAMNALHSVQLDVMVMILLAAILDVI